MTLQKTEENNRAAKGKQAAYTIFSTSSGASGGASAALTSLTPSAQAATSTTVWNATVVIQCSTEAEAQYMVSHVDGLNTNVQLVGYDTHEQHDDDCTYDSVRLH